MFRRIAGMLVAAAAVLAVALPGTAQAGQNPGWPTGGDAATASGGTLTLFFPQGRFVTYGYPSCPFTPDDQLDRIVGFDNRPPTGCLATLVNPAGQVFNLCFGEGSVPPAFQTAQVRVVRGVSVPC